MKKHLFALLLALCLIVSLAVVVSAEEAEYTVTVTCGEHGTVEDSLFTAKAGETVTINVTADAGYHLDTTDTFTYSAEITDLSKRGNVVTFTMPECDVTVDLAMIGNYYELSHYDSGYGSVTVEPYCFRTGDTVTITVTPDPGYAFTGYSEDLERFTGVMDIPPEGGSWTFTVPELSIGSSVGVTVVFYFEREYTVTAEVVGGGSAIVTGSFWEGTRRVTVRDESVRVFADVDLSILLTADEGYTYTGFSVSGNKEVATAINSITGDMNKTHAQVLETNGVDTHYRITIPNSQMKDIVLTFYFVRNSPFTDVASDKYYYDPVIWAVDHGITTGKTDTEFAPNDFCTRDQVVTFLWRAAGSPEPTSTYNPFTDVKESDYYYKAVLWAVEKGITKGMTDDTFGPKVECTRGHVVTFLWRSQGEPASQGKNIFTDVSADKYYYDAVLWAVENEVTKGATSTTFAPGNNCTRGQIVTFLYRTMA